MGFVQIDNDEFDRLTFLAHVGARLIRIEANAIERGHHTTADAIHRLIAEIGKALREGADEAICDPAAIRAQFEADAQAEAMKPENAPLVRWAMTGLFPKASYPTAQSVLDAVAGNGDITPEQLARHERQWSGQEISDREWAAQDPSLREGSTVRVPGVDEL